MNLRPKDVNAPSAGAPVLRTGERTPATPQQARSIEKRSKLMVAGLHLFGEKGYQSTSIAEITSRAGTAAGAFYQFFPSKREFLVALMNEFLERLARLNLNPQGGADVQTGLRHFLTAGFRVDAGYNGVVRAWQEAVLSDTGLRRMQKEIEAWTRVRVLSVFELLQKHPQARPNRDLPSFAAMMDRHFWSLLARGSRLPPREFNREVQVAADVIYHFLFRDPRGRTNS